MKKILNNNLKIAIQKNGRLNEDSYRLLTSAGLKFDNYNQNLLNTCKNLPIDVIFLRDDDIPKCVDLGIVDLGIIGKNILLENNVRINTLLELGFGTCSLYLAAPKKLNIKNIEDFKNLRIATSYPRSTNRFFKEKKIPVKIIKINGSTEIFPTLNMSDAIVDIVSSGKSLALNKLKKIIKIYDSQAVLIANKSLKLFPEKYKLVKYLLTNIK